MENQQDKQKDYLLPISIVIAALLISGSWIYTAGLKSVKPESGVVTKSTSNTADNINLRLVNSNDHILGNPNAPIKIVEFSDLECPFCKSFHSTMKRVMQEYGKDGRVAWVYRHYPLDELHPKARYEAEASECANELGGNEKFWAYVDRVFAVTPSNNGLDPDLLPQIAEYVGLDKTKFQSCLDNGKYADRVKADVEDAQNAGARGTPYSVVLGKDGKKYPIGGAQPYEQVKLLIDEVLK